MASSSFFKIVMAKDLQERKLKLPESAVVMYGDFLGEKVVLKVPNGAKWPIGLTSRGGKVWLNKGWSKFAEFYSLDHGYLLMFRYKGDHSHFHVRIFTRSCLEKDLFGSFSTDEDSFSGETDNVGSRESSLMGPCSKRNGKGPAFPVNAPSFFKVVLGDTLRDGKIKIPPLGLMKYEDFIGDKMFLEVPNGSVWPVKLSRRGCEIWLRKGWLKFARFYFLELGCLLLFTYKGVYSHFQVRIFRRNTLEMDYFNLSDEAESDSNSSGEIEGQRMKHDKEMMTHGGDGGMSADAHRSSEVRWRTAHREMEDKNEGSFAKARSFKSRNPFVVIRMRRSYISTHLKVPIYFAQENICESGERKVTLKISDTRSWSVKCIVHAYNCQTCARFQDKGWKAFVRDNKLEEGDVCAFEVIPKASKCTLKVYIFRAEDQE